MSAIADRLDALGLTLPEPGRPPSGGQWAFERVRVVEGLAHVSGHGPVDGATVLLTGKVGAELDAEAGARAAAACALSMLASLQAELGELERVTSWVRVLGFVNCAPGFTELPSVLNGFSELIVALWGERGRHARSAIGAAELPFGIPVEVEATVTVEAR
jgi:enamine deaminase RidA (YjgF/YER057c/UK114 family)